MMKYKSKKIDYTGCNPIIAEHLQRGEAVQCKDQDGRKVHVVAYEPLSPSYRVKLCDNGNIVWRQSVNPIPTTQRIMPPERAIPVLIAEGWKFDADGRLEKGCDIAVFPRMFRIMGRRTDDQTAMKYTWPSCIIEDVDG